jgi:CDP-glucose 4,6-dehydratase
MGTLNILEAARFSGEVKAIVVATTDKVYRNNEWPWGYRETDFLGGLDPYSSSKSAAEFLVASYRESFLKESNTPIATVRAGNVIGGGDQTPDRLVPDIMNALYRQVPLRIRNPKATRPWQHVLDCLSAYLVVGQMLLRKDESAEGSWNVGPRAEGNFSVQSLLGEFETMAQKDLPRHEDVGFGRESNLLFLDSSKVRSLLGWSEVWGPKETIKRTFDWYAAFYTQGLTISQDQLEDYISDAIKAKAEWANR